jgi:hypothetical protein
VHVEHGELQAVHLLSIGFGYVVVVGQVCSHLFPDRNTAGLTLELQLVQLVTLFVQVAQGDWHRVQTLLMLAVPSGQVSTHRFPLKFLVSQDVQLVWVTVQVAQSPKHGWAIPDILTYPAGTVD